ncbi:hypothetical protein ABGB14_35635 [Nonomuraea sp. B10E15]
MLRHDELENVLIVGPRPARFPPQTYRAEPFHPENGNTEVHHAPAG